MTDDVTRLSADEVQGARATQPGWTPGPPPPPSPGWQITERPGKRRRPKRIGVIVLVFVMVLAGGTVMANRIVKDSEVAIVAAARGITRAEQKARALEVVQEVVASIGADSPDRYCATGSSPLAQTVGPSWTRCMEAITTMKFTPLDREAARAGFDSEAVDFRISDDLPGFVCLWIPSSAWYIQSELSHYDVTDACVYLDEGRWYRFSVEPGDEVVDVDEFAADIMAARVYAKTLTG